jgi:hypothetical protein
MSSLTVSHPHVATYRDPITIRTGEEIQVGPEDTDYPGWVWCTDSRGRSGWVPKSILEFSYDGTEARSFEPYDAVELSVSVGEQVNQIQEESGWVWCENGEGKLGWVPKECFDQH